MAPEERQRSLRDIPGRTLLLHKELPVQSSPDTFKKDVSKNSPIGQVVSPENPGNSPCREMHL